MTEVRRIGVVRGPGCGVMLLALLLLTAIPLAEVVILVQSARTIGIWWTIGLCLLTGVVGSALARWQGTRVLLQAQRSLAEGRFPADALLDGACLLVGGVLLLTPGFVTDALGLVLLLPPSRALLKAGMRRWWRRRSGTIDIRPL